MNDFIQRLTKLEIEVAALQKARPILKWFTFDQNNSGGHYEIDANVAHYVSIQAPSARAAITKASEVCDNSGSCPCCGDRWYLSAEDADGTDEPLYCGEALALVSAKENRESRLHYYDGRVEVLGCE